MAVVTLDPLTDEYSYTLPSGEIRTTSRREETQRIEKEIDTLSAALIALALLLNERRIDAEEFQQRAVEILKQIHIYSAVLGGGGWHNIDADATREIEREVQRQVDGQNADGSRYGLRYLAALALAGQISLAMLQARLGAYARSGKISYWQAYRRRYRGRLARRVLGLADKHCQCCVDQAMLEPMPIEEIHPIGQCECLSNCKCSVEVVTLTGEGWIALEPDEDPF